jgi:hypothetical protein
MYFDGLIIGFAVFLMIGLFHPLVVKAEKYMGKKSKWIFAVVCLISVIMSMYALDWVSIFWGCLGFSCFWSIFEIDKQEKRRLRTNKEL